MKQSLADEIVEIEEVEKNEYEMMGDQLWSHPDLHFIHDIRKVNVDVLSTSSIKDIIKQLEEEITRRK